MDGTEDQTMTSEEMNTLRVFETKMVKKIVVHCKRKTAGE
jgi:hypothetical protein